MTGGGFRELKHPKLLETLRTVSASVRSETRKKSFKDMRIKSINRIILPRFKINSLKIPRYRISFRVDRNRN